MHGHRASGNDLVAGGGDAMSIKELKTPEGYTIVLDVKDAIVRVGDAWVPVGERLRELEAQSRLALAVAEVRAWRGLWVAMKSDRNGSHTQEVLKKLAAEAATDADPVLAKMIGGGE